MRLPARHPTHERIASGIHPIIVREIRPRRFPSYWHQHAELELTLILAGSGTRLVGEAAGRFGPGDCCLIGGDLPHAWISGQHAAAAHALVVQFSTACAGPVAQRLIGELDRRAGGGLRLTGRLRDLVQERMLRLLAESNPLARLGQLLELLAVIAAGDPSPLSPGRGIAARSVPPGLQRAAEHVDAHLGEQLSQAHCARLAGLSPASFSRAFHRVFGRTFSDYLLDRRLALAGRLLADSTRPVQAIATGCGFASPSHFGHAFRRRMGRTPGSYRSLWRSGPR